MRVYVYYNLHKKCWSVKALEGPNKGRIVAHKNNVALSNVRMHVNENGRQRVVQNQRKEVHAGLIGDWVEDRHVECKDGSWTAIGYNPFKASTFTDRDTHRPVWAAQDAMMYSTIVVVNHAIETQEVAA